MLDTKALAEATAVIVREHVERATAPLFARIAELEARPEQRGVQGEPGKDGADGVSVDPLAVERMVAEAVAIAVATLPAPVAGNDGRDGIDGRDGLPGKDGIAGERGKDGAGIGDLLIDRDGALVATFTDGRTKSLGVVVGKNGTDGLPGKDGETFTLDDFDIVPYDDGRTIKLCFTRGEAMHSFELAFPVVLDRGVFATERQYEKGDAVTWAGSLWIAQKDTSAKPDTADSGWRLAVKRGRDGKDVK